jgi:hypothetical protein
MKSAMDYVKNYIYTVKFDICIAINFGNIRVSKNVKVKVYKL